MSARLAEAKAAFKALATELSEMGGDHYAISEVDGEHVLSCNGDEDPDIRCDDALTVYSIGCDAVEKAIAEEQARQAGAPRFVGVNELGHDLEDNDWLREA